MCLPTKVNRALVITFSVLTVVAGLVTVALCFRMILVSSWMADTASTADKED